MIKKLLLTLGVMAMTGLVLHQMRAASKEGLLREQFKTFRSQYSKSYDSLPELEYRFEIFKQSLREIDAINSDPSKTHTAGVNKFSDLTFAEFKSKYLTFKGHKSNRARAHAMPEDYLKGLSDDNSGKMDWRDQEGAVGPVKDQKSCGSCWAFSTVSSLETEVWKKTGTSVSLSEQELIDCAWRLYCHEECDEDGCEEVCNQGCNGGMMMNGYKYILENQVATESSYPYRELDMKCNLENKKKAGRQSPDAFYMVPGGVENLTKSAKKHVVSVAYEVAEDFQHYSSGVYTNNDPDCGKQLSHAVNVVGFNYDANTPYYIVRNSWGTDFGMDGYFQMAIGREGTIGTCGIASDATNVVPVYL